MLFCKTTIERNKNQFAKQFKQEYKSHSKLEQLSVIGLKNVNIIVLKIQYVKYPRQQDKRIIHRQTPELCHSCSQLIALS